jgi:hypothetical protein
VKWNIASSINYVRLELSPVFISKFPVGCLRREGSINIAPTLLDERSRNWGFGSQEGHGMCLSDRHWAHPDSHKISIGGSSRGYLQLMPRLRMHGAIPSHSLYISMVWCLFNNDSFTFCRNYHRYN